MKNNEKNLSWRVVLVLVFKWSKNHGTTHYFVTKHLRILINQTSKAGVNSVKTALATERTVTKFRGMLLKPVLTVTCFFHFLNYKVYSILKI